MKWLELSLEVDGELAEAIAELLLRYVPNNVAIEHLHRGADDNSDIISQNEVIVRAFLEIDDNLSNRQSQIETGLWHLGQIRPIPSPTYRELDETDWADSWKTHYDPIPVGDRFLIQPSWLSVLEHDRLPIILNPSMAFGTGTHPTTQLCLIAIEKFLSAGETLIDVGCGSGILSIGAARLGARKVLGFDIDPTAVVIARRNVLRNHLADRVLIREGSLQSLATQLPAGMLPVSVVVINILHAVIEEIIVSGMINAIITGGTLLLSGILDHQTDTLLSITEKHGWHNFQTLVDEDWRALVLIKKPPS